MLEQEKRAEKERQRAEREHQQAVYEEKYLKGMLSVVLPGKQVCFSYALTGDCEFEEPGKMCRYSHEAKDVERFKDAQALGPKFLEESRQRDQLMASRGVSKNARLHLGQSRRRSGTLAVFRG
jgi:hypothetical protein